MVVASYSFKVYRASSERNSKLFSLAFILIALSYFTLAILNLIFLSVIRGELRVLSLDEFTTLKNLAIYSYIALFILGFATLLCSTFRTKNRSVYFALVLTAFLGVYISAEKSVYLYLFSSLMLTFVAYHQAKECQHHKTRNCLLVFLGMFFLLAAQIVLVAQAFYFISSLYVVSNFLELTAYLLLIASLSNVLKYGKKKKPSGNYP